jgi:hypothetical protein
MLLGAANCDSGQIIVIMSGHGAAAKIAPTRTSSAIRMSIALEGIWSAIQSSTILALSQKM